MSERESKLRAIENHLLSMVEPPFSLPIKSVDKLFLQVNAEAILQEIEQVEREYEYAR